MYTTQQLATATDANNQKPAIQSLPEKNQQW